MSKGPSAQKACLEVKHITTQFGSNVIHDAISFTLYEKEMLAIVGGSGTGKSVMLKYMMGLNRPQKGKVIYYPPFSLENIGVLFQSGALISSLSVLENIMLPLLKVARMDSESAAELALSKLKMVGLKETDMTKMPSSLSGGMIKRVGLARALILEPKILFLDEPTAGLDPLAANEFDDLVLDLRNNFDLTVVMITHDLDTLAKVCDHIGVLVDKKLIIKSKEDILRVDHPWVHAYFHGERGKRLFET